MTMATDARNVLSVVLQTANVPSLGPTWVDLHSHRSDMGGEWRHHCSPNILPNQRRFLAKYPFQKVWMMSDSPVQ